MPTNNKKDWSTFKNELEVELGSCAVISDDRLFSICYRFRHELPKKQRKWNKLAEVLNIGKSGDAIRIWFYRQNNQDIKKDLEKSTGEQTMDEMDVKIEKLYKEKTKVRDRYNAIRRTLRDEARIEDIKHSVQNCVKLLNDLPHFSYKGKQHEGNREAVLMLSDLHIGDEFKNSVNEYSIEIAAKRLDKLCDKTIQYCKENKVNRLNVVNLGDLISGNIHVTCRIENQADVISQTMIAAELVCKFLNKVQQAAPDVVYRSVVDNHSRITPDKNQHIEKENLQRIIDWHVESRLENTDIRFPKDNLDDGLGRFVLQNGKKVIFSHGHQDNINSVFSNFIGATQDFFHYALLGHYHCSKEKQFQNMTVFVNGSIIGTNSYAYGRRLFGSPSQKLIVFNNDDVIDYTIDLK